MKKRLAAILFAYLLIVSVAVAQVQLAPDPKFPPSYPLFSKMVAWWRVMSGNYGGPTWYDRVGGFHGTLTNMGSGSGWVPSGDPIATGGINFDGVDDYVDIGDIAALNFANQTFTVSIRFMTTATTQGNMVIKRIVTAPCAPNCGGYFVRLDATTGVLNTRLVASDGSAATSRPSVNAYNDGKPHRATVVFTTDTSVTVNNTMDIYADGKLDNGTLTQTNAYFACPCNLRFGHSADLASGSQYTGILTDVMFFAGRLSDSEIQALDMIDVGWSPLPTAYDLLTLLTGATVRVKHKVVQP